MKGKGYGQAKVLSEAEIEKLFTQLSHKPRDSCLFAICFFTACRISEALQLTTDDVTEDAIIFRKSITKGKLDTRSIFVHPALRIHLLKYLPTRRGALFPGQRGRNEFMSREHADRILRRACEQLGLKGVSTHSFRRSALTFMSANGTPLREIQEISGHKNLQTLQRYLEVSPDRARKAVNSIWL